MKGIHFALLATVIGVALISGYSLYNAKATSFKDDDDTPITPVKPFAPRANPAQTPSKTDSPADSDDNTSSSTTKKVSTEQDTTQSGDSLPVKDPPLQNGHINLEGVYEVKTYYRQNATHFYIDVDYNGPETTYAMDKNKLITHVQVVITISSNTEMGIKFVDRDSQRFEVPYTSIFPHDKVFEHPAENDFHIQVIPQTFALVIKRRSTNEIIFDTSNMFFVYSDLYTEISIAMKDEHIYGLGERRQQFLYKSGQYTFLNKDQYMTIADGHPNTQTYGIHPMYLRREESAKYHVVYLRNYNAQQVQYTLNDSLTFITVGGLLEFKIFLGDDFPDSALTQYHRYINGFAMHPFWSHGYHQCRWGYDNSTKMVSVWEEFNKLDLPIDTIWSDIDYMANLTDFTIDSTRYNAKQMNQMLDRQKASGVHWVPIIDAGIAIGNESNQRGKELNVYQKSNKTKEDLLGCVWPGKVNFVDFNHPLSYDFWAEGLKNLTRNYNITPSGFWIDMNEFSNFVNGELSETDVCIMPNDPNAPVDEQYLGITVEDFYTYIPFEVGGQYAPLQQKTMSQDAPKYNKKDAKTAYYPGGDLREFDFHNLNGYSEGIATNHALKEMGNKLPFIISRSQVAGAGKFIQHWTGDNGSAWIYLQTSLSEIFNFNLYAMPMTGVDICGFAMNTTPELCARWMQVGAFYPFSRNHNSNDTIPQEPYAFPNDPYVLSSSRSSLKLRYALLKQYYSYFVLSKGVGSIFKPVFFNFPADSSLLNSDNAFMISDALLGIPVLTQSTTPEKQTTELKLYFPKGSAFYRFNEVNSKRYTNADSGKVLNIPFDATTPLYLREGYTVFTQFDNLSNRARLLNNHFELHVALKKDVYFYHSQGRFLTINSYDDDNLINHCLGENNCGIRATVLVYPQGDSKVLVEFQVHPLADNTVFQTIYVNKFTFYSEDLSLTSNTVSVDMEISQQQFYYFQLTLKTQ